MANRPFPGTHEAAVAYLAGIIDGEGTVSRPGAKSRAVIVGNTDPAIITATTRCLDTLQIAYKLNEVKGPKRDAQPHLKKCWTVTVGTREGLQLLLDYVPLQAPDKLARLQHAVAAYRPDPPTAEELSFLYEQEKLSSYALAARFGVTPPTIRAWLRLRGIDVRDKASAQKAAWIGRR